jgi:hypothetical protein
MSAVPSEGQDARPIVRESPHSRRALLRRRDLSTASPSPIGVTHGHRRRSARLGLHNGRSRFSEAGLQPYQAGPRPQHDTDDRATPTLSHTTAFPAPATTTSARHLSPLRVLTPPWRRPATAPIAPTSPSDRTTPPCTRTTPPGAVYDAIVRLAASPSVPHTATRNRPRRPFVTPTATSRPHELARLSPVPTFGRPNAGRGRPAASSA